MMKMILPAMSITFIPTRLNTGMVNVRLIGLIRHFTAMCVMGYMRVTGLLRWKVRCRGMIDAARVGTPSGCENLYEAKSCPPYWAGALPNHAVDDTPQNLTILIDSALRKVQTNQVYLPPIWGEGYTSLGGTPDNRYSLGATGETLEARACN
ncbi:MAG: hypothetical protein WAT12_13675 [Candidatus Nitrotoga sp.]